MALAIASVSPSTLVAEDGGAITITGTFPTLEQPILVYIAGETIGTYTELDPAATSGDQVTIEVTVPPGRIAAGYEVWVQQVGNGFNNAVYGNPGFDGLILTGEGGGPIEPDIDSSDPASLTQAGGTVVVTGTFDPEVEYTGHLGSTELDTVLSGDGTTLEFTVPPGLEGGTYALTVTYLRDFVPFEVPGAALTLDIEVGGIMARKLQRTRVHVRIETFEVITDRGVSDGPARLLHVLDYDKEFLSGTTDGTHMDRVWSSDTARTTTPTDLDLVSSSGLPSALDNSLNNSFVDLCVVAVTNEETTGAGYIKVGGDGTNPLAGLFDAVNDKLRVLPEGLFLWVAPYGLAPVADTGDILQLEASTGTINSKSLLLGRSA